MISFKSDSDRPVGGSRVVGHGVVVDAAPDCVDLFHHVSENDIGDEWRKRSFFLKVKFTDVVKGCKKLYLPSTTVFDDTSAPAMLHPNDLYVLYLLVSSHPALSTKSLP
jgi:hypothetical protein